MNFLVTADWHISNRNSRFKVDNNGVSDLLKAQAEFVDWIVEELSTYDYDGFLFLGDLTDYATLDPVTMTFVNDMVGKLVGTGKPMIFIEGNHCISDKQNNYTVVEALSKIVDSENCHFVSKNETIKWNIDGQDIAFHCFSYLSDFDKIESDIALANAGLDTSIPNVMLFHFPTTNAVLDNGVNSTNGVNLSQELTSNFSICLGGDFHRPQQLVNNDKAYYVGAPFDLKFGQDGDRHVAVLTVNEKGCSLKTVQNPFNFPMITLDGSTAVKEIEQVLAGRERMIVRLSSPPSEEDRLKLESLRQELYSLTIPGVRKVAKPELENVRVIETFDSGKDLDVINRLVKTYDVDPEVKEAAGKVFQQIAELV